MPPDSPPPAVSRRGLYIAGVSLGHCCHHDRGVRHYDAQSRRRQAAGMDRKSGGAGRCRRGARYARQNDDVQPSRPVGGLHAGANLRAGHRLCERLEGRYRHSGKIRSSCSPNIDAPDLDQQIMQAEANLASAKANSALSDMTLTRGQSLIKTYAISQQDLDQRSSRCLEQTRTRSRGAGESRSPARARTI